MNKLFFILILLVTSWQLASAYDFMVNKIAYNINSDKKSVTVTYTANMSTNNYSGLTVANIPSYVYNYDKVYTVTNIGDKAFQYCSGLTKVTIPNSVINIGYNAFWNCSRLTSITIPNTVTSIGDKSFQYCSGLTSLTIPNSVTSIGESAFYGCSGITSVTIGNSVTTIGDNAFESCYGLTRVEYNATECAGPSSDKGIWFKNCRLDTLVIGENVKFVPSYLAYYQSKLTNVTISNSVTSIGNNAFYYCSGLESIIIPSSVTSISNGAFSFCGKLKMVFSENPTPPSIDLYCFSNNTYSDAFLVVPNGSKEKYNNATGWENFKIIKEIESYDINEDGNVDVLDINILINIITGFTPSANYKGLADVNNDGKVDISDINTIINVLLN